MFSSASSAPDDDDASSSSPGSRKQNTLVSQTQDANNISEESSEDDFDDDSLPGLDETLPGLGEAPAGLSFATNRHSSSSIGSSESNKHQGLSASSSNAAPQDSSHDEHKRVSLELQTNADNGSSERALGIVSEDCVHLPNYDSNQPSHPQAETSSKSNTQESHDLVQTNWFIKQDEVNRLREKEDQFWKTLPSESADKLRGMLQVVSLYQSQLRENENVIDDLHVRIESKDKTQRGFRRRFQQSQLATTAVEEEAANLEQAYEHWARKCERYAHDNHTNTWHAKHQHLQQELQRLLEEAGPARDTLLDVRTRLDASLLNQEERRSYLAEYQEHCKQGLETIKAEHGVQLSELREEEFAKLKSSLVTARAHVRHLSRENEDVVEDLKFQQQESARLQQQCSESREKVLELAAQVSAYLEEPRVAAQLGVSLDGTMASMSFLPFYGEDPYHDAELESLRRQCKAIERDCQRTNDALERKQLECERWRARYLERRPTNFEVLPEDRALGEAPAPFVLGPRPGAAEENLVMTPRF